MLSRMKGTNMTGHTPATGTQLELNSLIIEYQNQFDRSNKLDNKVYIAITFCGFLFVFIIGLFNGISQLQKPIGAAQAFLSALYIFTCISVMICYVYVLVFFMRLLQPEQIARMDPDLLMKEKLDELDEEAACQKLIQLYRQTINGNLEKLKHRCDEFVKGLRFIVPTVLLAFAAYVFQIGLQVL